MVAAGRPLPAAVMVPALVEVVALEKGEPWEQFRDRHGDRGRDVALRLGRRHSGLTLQELGQEAGAMTCPAGGRCARSSVGARRMRSWIG